MTNEQMLEAQNRLEKETMPFGLFYKYNSTLSPTLNFENEKQIERFIRLRIFINNDSFTTTIKKKNKVELIDELNAQLFFYSERTKEITPWLENTKKIFKKHIEDIHLRYAFDEWLKERNKELVERKEVIKETVLSFLKNELTQNYNDWKQKLNNPLATELQFLNFAKTKCEKAISKAQQLNEKLNHGEPSILLSNETNELTKLEIINQRLIELKESKQGVETKKSDKKKVKKKSFSHKQIAIAYYIIGNPKIDANNYKEILKKHSNTHSNKILQKLITKNSQLTELKEDKTADTKHLNDLNKAVELLSGIKKTKEVERLMAFISTFESNYNGYY